MAAIAITEPVDGGDVDGLVQKLDNEMQFLLDGAEVPAEVQAKLAPRCRFHKYELACERRSA